MADFPKVEEGEVVTPRMDGYQMKCCDCDLIHTFRFRAIRVTERHGDATRITLKHEAETQVDEQPAPGVRACGNCKGTGKQLGDPCRRCNGTGHDKHEQWCVGGEQDGICNCGADGVKEGERG